MKISVEQRFYREFASLAARYKWPPYPLTLVLSDIYRYLALAIAIPNVLNDRAYAVRLHFRLYRITILSPEEEEARLDLIDDVERLRIFLDHQDPFPATVALQTLFGVLEDLLRRGDETLVEQYREKLMGQHRQQRAGCLLISLLPKPPTTPPSSA